jgi:hypothetical protein
MDGNFDINLDVDGGDFLLWQRELVVSHTRIFG